MYLLYYKLSRMSSETLAKFHSFGNFQLAVLYILNDVIRKPFKYLSLFGVSNN